MTYSQERPYEYETVYLCCINMGVIPGHERLASAAVTAQAGLRVAGDDDTKV